MGTYINKPPTMKPVWFCTCRRWYESEAECAKCMASDEKADVEAGDIVLIDIGYSWYDGDVKWLVLNTGTFHDKKTHSAYFIVTGVSHEEHRLHVHVKTLGIKNGNETGLEGWTTKGTHKNYKKVDKPELAKEAQQFIGQMSKHLL